MALFPSKGAHSLSRQTNKIERNNIRHLLKKAARGNLNAFVQASTHYLDLLSEYLYLLGYTNPIDRGFEIQKLLAESWRYIPYTRRVSDFERFTQIQLEGRSESSTLDLPAPHAQLASLNHRERFLLVAREFESWSLKALRLALREKKPEVSRSLMHVKNKIIGFRYNMLKPVHQAQVQRLNDLLEGQLSSKEVRAVEKEVSGDFNIQRFKADWLVYRCELVELRQEMVLSPEQKTILMERLAFLLKQAPTERPKLADSIINQFSFNRLPHRAN